MMCSCCVLLLLFDKPICTSYILLDIRCLTSFSLLANISDVAGVAAVSECLADGDTNLRCTTFQVNACADNRTASDVGGVLQSPVGAAFGVTVKHSRRSRRWRILYTTCNRVFVSCHSNLCCQPTSCILSYYYSS